MTIKRLGRPRTRPRVRRLTVEVDEQLLAAVESEVGTSPLRAVVEDALRYWLAKMESTEGQLWSKK